MRTGRSAEAVDGDEASAGDRPQDDGPGTGAPSAPSGGRWRAIRQHWRAVVAASALLLVIGVGAGWMLFGRGAIPVTLPAAQQDALAMLEDGPFDDGSVTFVGEKHGVAVWQATTGDGVRECIVLTHGDEQASECRPNDEEPTTEGFIGLSTSIDLEEDGETFSVWATIMPDITGQSVTLVQRSQSYSGDWRDQYAEAEIAAVERLEAEGFDPFELYLAGYDGELAIWQGHLGATNCVLAVIGADVLRGCGDALEERLQLRIGETLYEVVQTTNRGPMLTIIRGAADPGETGAPLELGGEHGDPIEVRPDSPAP
ncbi:anti-sigma factor [Microbacterium sp. SD291]|nr:anti-sigma factor [Microbacterium sp. SD291]